MTKTFNPRLTIVMVLAFLFIVALFVSPGGPAEQIVPPPAELATAAPLPQASAAPRPTTPAEDWNTAPEVTPPLESPTPPAEPAGSGGEPAAAPAAVPGADGQPVLVNPPPQGPDFPPSH